MPTSDAHQEHLAIWHSKWWGYRILTGPGHTNQLSHRAVTAASEKATCNLNRAWSVPPRLGTLNKANPTARLKVVVSSILEGHVIHILMLTNTALSMLSPCMRTEFRYT